MRKRFKRGSAIIERNLVRWCHLYIRLRDLKIDLNGNIYGNCISCGKRWDVALFSDRSIYNNGAKWVAGHYYKSDKIESTRYDVRNINLQCYRCNKPLSGNESEYQINLIKKIGRKEFDKLVIKKNNPYTYNIIELENLKNEFQELAKIEAKRLNIKI